MSDHLTDTNVGNIEYIRRDDAITAACKGFCHPGVRCPDEPCREQTKYLRELSSADVVQVCRCKDCIHNNDCDIQHSAQAGDNFFCGFGETEKDVREDVYE